MRIGQSQMEKESDRRKGIEAKATNLRAAHRLIEMGCVVRAR